MIGRILNKIIPNFIIHYYKLAKSTAYPIVLKPENFFERVYTVKDESWEYASYPECYGHCKEQCLEVFAPAEYIYKTDNGIVSLNSDVVITNKGAYWGKYNTEEFVTFAEPCDANVYWFDRTNIRIRRNRKKEYISGRVISLVGVWSYHWAHCMYQYLHKLFSAGEAGLLDMPITIIVSENEDQTIVDIINDYIKVFTDAKIMFAKSHVDYTCEELYFLPCAGSAFNNSKYRLDFTCYISAHVMEQTKRYVVDPLIEKIKQNTTKYDKIFLPRGSHNILNQRTLINYNEVHDYFLSIGFVDIEGSSLTLEQKADIFYHANEVVGLYGSALQNLIFGNHTKCLVFTNYRMSTDASLYLQVKNYVDCWINITGQDDNSEFHSNYYIPIEKIKKAYEERIAGKIQK